MATFLLLQGLCGYVAYVLIEIEKKKLSHLKIKIHNANVTPLMLHPTAQLFIGRLRWRTNKWGRISHTFIDIASYAYVTSLCQVPMTFASESIIQSGCLYLS